MAFAIKGTVGTVRHRIHPRRVRGERGIVNKHSKQSFRKVELNAKQSFDFARTSEKKNVLTRALSKVKSIFGRGNR